MSKRAVPQRSQSTADDEGAQDILVQAIHDNNPIHGLTHNYYRYPACFAPSFARAAISKFSSPGDIVFDPFMGGGTTLVEALALGRDCIGTDISSIAAFISTVKTTVLSQAELDSISLWSNSLHDRLCIHKKISDSSDSPFSGYAKKLPWQIRKIILLILSYIPELSKKREEEFVRCVLLKTSQWAIDGRKEFPSVDEFRNKFFFNLNTMSADMNWFRLEIKASQKEFNLTRSPKCICLTRSAIGLEKEKRLEKLKIKPKLVLTSPPYPGTHVLYHRWQLLSGKETAAPFWIIQSTDGMGESKYALGSRKQVSQDNYFNNIHEAFVSLRKIIDDDGYFVQLVSFSDFDKQLPRYLECLKVTGFEEIDNGDQKNPSSRILRNVPNRKWYTNLKNDMATRKEVMLIHRPA